MIYDPRPVSEGGNRGAGELFQLKAPAGKFRVVGVDTFDGTDWIERDFNSKDEALSHANWNSGTMLKMHVYDDQERTVDSFGSF